MKKILAIGLLLLFIAVSQNIHSQELSESQYAEVVEIPLENNTSPAPPEESQDETSGALSITDKAVYGFHYIETNRSERSVWNLSAIGELELNDFILGNAGLSLGEAGRVFNTKLFAAAGVSPFSKKYLAPLSFSLKWLYSNLSEYKEHIHSILPMITYGTDTVGILLGFNFRFSWYYGASQFEPVFTYLFYWNIINNDLLRFGIEWGTYGDFYARNMGAMALHLNIDMHINQNWTILSKIEYYQSGQDGFAANFYGFSWKGGVRFSW